MPSDPVPLLDFKHLRSGQVYRVRRAFLDADGLDCKVDPDLPMPVRGMRAEAYLTGHEHRVGEEWTYLTHRVSGPGELVLLCVRDPEGYREEIPLRTRIQTLKELKIPSLQEIMCSA